MQKLSFLRETTFAQLPLSLLNAQRYSIYVLDRDWNYLFVNEFVHENLGTKGENLTGKNMWTTFPELASHPVFMVLRERTEAGLDSDLMTISPLTFRRIHVYGEVLSDCFFFASSVVQLREKLVSGPDTRQEDPAKTR
jgi:hypothetical protein